MTQRQRRYWKAYYKYSNYTRMLETIKGIKPKETLDIPDDYIEGKTLWLENQAHFMYLTLKSLVPSMRDLVIEDTRALSQDEILDLAKSLRKANDAKKNKAENTSVPDTSDTESGDDND